MVSVKSLLNIGRNCQSEKNWKIIFSNMKHDDEYFSQFDVSKLNVRSCILKGRACIRSSFNSPPGPLNVSFIYDTNSQLRRCFEVQLHLFLLIWKESFKNFKSFKNWFFKLWFPLKAWSINKLWNYFVTLNFVQFPFLGFNDHNLIQ